MSTGQGQYSGFYDHTDSSRFLQPTSSAEDDMSVYTFPQGQLDIPSISYPSMIIGFNMSDPSYNLLPYSQDDLSHASHAGNEDYSTVAQHPRPLRVDTVQLSPFPLYNDSGSSAESPFLPTPHLQVQVGTQPYIHTSSPISAPADLQRGLSHFGKIPFTLASPTTPHSAGPEGSVFGESVSPHPEDEEEEPQVPMAHVANWKMVAEMAVIQTGPRIFVPQRLYQPYTEADRVRYIRDAELKETIFFYSSQTFEWGVSLEDALKARLKHLKDKDEEMFIGCGPSVSIRIQWPGYRPWTKQIPTMDFKTPKRPITKAKLAKNIANCVRRFIEITEKQAMDSDVDRRWKVGKRNIKVEDLILVSLHHASKGSWQPQLRLRRPLPELTSHHHRDNIFASSSFS